MNGQRMRITTVIDDKLMAETLKAASQVQPINIYGKESLCSTSAK